MLIHIYSFQVYICLSFWTSPTSRREGKWSTNTTEGCLILHPATRRYDSGMMWSNVYLFEFWNSLWPNYFSYFQLEGSGNWPTDEVAIEKTKTAFLLKIGERWAEFDFVMTILTSLFWMSIWWSQYGSLQNVWGMRCIASEDAVNVLVSGYAFHLKIWHERGLSLLNKECKVSSLWHRFMQSWVWWWCGVGFETILIITSQLNLQLEVIYQIGSPQQIRNFLFKVSILAWLVDYRLVTQYMDRLLGMYWLLCILEISTIHSS